MCAIVDLRKLRGCELRVALCGREALVAQQFLDGAQVGAFFQQVRAEGVAQCVWVHIRRQASKHSHALDDAAHAACSEACVVAGLV